MNPNPVVQFIARFFGGLFRLLGRAANAFLEAFWDDVFRPLLRRVAGSWITWVIVAAIWLGWAQKHPGSAGASLADQVLSQGLGLFTAALPMVVGGALLYSGLTSILRFRPGRRRGHDRHGRDRH